MKNLKQIIVLIGLGIVTLIPINAQKVYHSVTSEVNFNAGKKIAAESKTSKFIYRTSDNALVGLITIKDFVFPNSLMQEHFNENYLESDTYPNASFSGKLIDFNIDEVGINEKKYEAKGVMTIHGVEKEVMLPVYVLKNDKGGLKLKSDFKVLLKDYKIKIPKVVFVEIAQQASVNIETDLE